MTVENFLKGVVGRVNGKVRVSQSDIIVVNDFLSPHEILKVCYV